MEHEKALGYALGNQVPRGIQIRIVLTKKGRNVMGVRYGVYACQSVPDPVWGIHYERLGTPLVSEVNPSNSPQVFSVGAGQCFELHLKPVQAERMKAMKGIILQFVANEGKTSTASTAQFAIRLENARKTGGAR